MEILGMIFAFWAAVSVVGLAMLGAAWVVVLMVYGLYWILTGQRPNP